MRIYQINKWHYADSWKVPRPHTHTHKFILWVHLRSLHMISEIMYHLQIVILKLMSKLWDNSVPYKEDAE